MRDWISDSSRVVTGPRGQFAHSVAFEQAGRLVSRMEVVRPGVWCLIGNGLSNQTFIEGPEGIIAVDTGECVEEMNAALDVLASITDRPVVAVIYSHFHYVAGTRAVFERFGEVPVFGHERIPFNRARAANEIGPAYARGLVQQFATTLPLDGPDGNVSVGLGLHYRNPSHRPFTNGYVPPSDTWRGGERVTIAGLRVEVEHAPSDADDSVTLWFPEIDTCIQNNVWPLVFNVYAIRGEEYRNPQVMLPGIDHVLGLQPEHLVCAHGPSLSGRDEIQRRVTRYRDSIQLMWDQTVRHMNLGRTMDEIAHLVSLPPGSDDDYYTTEHYGLLEHHVRQIYTGIRGWFDDDPGRLFPLPPGDRAERLVAGFGGTEVVRNRVAEAVANDDLRWALEMASWLWWSSSCTDDDRRLLAGVLRSIGQRTTAANIRSWCLTRARDIEGTENLDRLRTHRLREQQVAAMSALDSVRLLRVLVDPQRAVGIDRRVRLLIGDQRVVLHVRNCVSVASVDSGDETDAELRIDAALWAKVLDGKVNITDAIANGDVFVSGDVESLRSVLDVFDVPGLRGGS